MDLMEVSFASLRSAVPHHEVGLAEDVVVGVVRELRREPVVRKRIGTKAKLAFTGLLVC
jgi:hypothetical protein